MSRLRCLAGAPSVGSILACLGLTVVALDERGIDQPIFEHCLADGPAAERGSPSS